ncbi:MAG: alpha/beta hydrolase fold domain-containing protein [Acidimicrobiales bacterium]
MPWVFMAVALVGLLFVLNAYVPPRLEAIAVPSFFAGWVTGELPVQHIVWQVGATVAFGLLGAFRSWPGWVGCGAAVVGWAGLAGLAVVGKHSAAIIAAAEEPEEAVTGESSRGETPSPNSGSETMWHWPRLACPLPVRPSEIEMTAGIDYAGDGMARHRLDVLHRRDMSLPGPVLIYVHGGAWIMGNKRQQGLPMLYEMARRGWVCVKINYRLSPRATWPDHIVDCKRAVSWVRANVAAYGGDPRFVAISGGSAGGQLCSLVALTSGDPLFQPGFEHDDASVDACVALYGVYDMTGCAATSYSRKLVRLLEKIVFKSRLADNPVLFERASPVKRVTAGAPPFYVVHGANDTLVPVIEARRFVTQLRAVSGSSVTYVELPLAQHAFDVLPSVRCANVVAGVTRFLERTRQSCSSRSA